MTSINYISSLIEFYKYLKINNRSLSMIIGFDITNSIDIARELDFDIGLNYYNTDGEKKIVVDKAEKQSKYLILDIDFNNFVVLNKTLITKFNNINCINKIVFDSSTFKFLSNIKLIAILYYITLEENGSIYIESNNPIFTGYLINNYLELNNLIKKNKKDGFCYPVGHILPKSLEKLIKKNSSKEIIEEITCNLISDDEIYLINIEFFKKWFYGSEVELLYNTDYPYPLINGVYPITKYYKITKKISHFEILEYLLANIELINQGLNLKKNPILRK